MDLGVRTPPAVNSIRHEEHPIHSSNPGRKRKLQLEQQALPVSKHKFPQQCSSSSSSSSSNNSSDRGSPTSHHDLVPDGSSEDSVDETETDPELHVIGGSSSNGSGRSGSSSSSLLEGSASAMALDTEGHVGTSTRIFVPHFEPSASPGSHEGVPSKDSFYSLDYRNGEKNNKDSGYQLPSFGADGGDNDDLDCQLPASELDELMEEECSHGPMEELGLHTLVLSSAKWNIKQDALPGAGRPSIDQEFEQYFSTFML